MHKWKDDMKHPGYESELYVPKTNVDHTISGQGTVISTLDHLVTTPRTKYLQNIMICPLYYPINRNNANTAILYLKLCYSYHFY